MHAGLANFSENKPLFECRINELIFERTDYSKVYFKDKIIVTGHTPTRNIKGNHFKDTIYKANNHIAIDCGCGYGGNLGVICLDNGQEFYI